MTAVLRHEPLDFRARFCYDRIRWVLRRRRPIYTTYDTVPPGIAGARRACAAFLGHGRLPCVPRSGADLPEHQGQPSGGERQKLALARVLIENKSVIFLDEATASMDKDSSQKILSQLLRTAGLTVISIEHKVSPELLPLYDQILELKDAHLVESV